MNEYNRKLEQKAGKVRAKYLRQHLAGISQADLARKAGVSRQRMHSMIKKAKDDARVIP